MRLRDDEQDRQDQAVADATETIAPEASADAAGPEARPDPLSRIALSTGFKLNQGGQYRLTPYVGEAATPAAGDQAGAAGARRGMITTRINALQFGTPNPGAILDAPSPVASATRPEGDGTAPGGDGIASVATAAPLSAAAAAAASRPITERETTVTREQAPDDPAKKESEDTVKKFARLPDVAEEVFEEMDQKRKQRENARLHVETHERTSAGAPGVDGDVPPPPAGSGGAPDGAGPNQPPRGPRNDYGDDPTAAYDQQAASPEALAAQNAQQEAQRRQEQQAKEQASSFDLSEGERVRRVLMCKSDLESLKGKQGSGIDYLDYNADKNRLSFGLKTPNHGRSFIETNGKELSLKSKNVTPESVEMMVKMAQRQGWNKVEVEGTPEFQQAVSDALSAAGIQVKGAGVIRPALEGQAPQPTAATPDAAPGTGTMEQQGAMRTPGQDMGLGAIGQQRPAAQTQPGAAPLTAGPLTAGGRPQAPTAGQPVAGMPGAPAAGQPVQRRRAAGSKLG